MNEFDQKAQEWDKNRMHLERTIAVAGHLQKMISFGPNMRAMEFGAGTGLLSFYLKNLFSEITLMDSSREMLKMAEEKMEVGDNQKLRTVLVDLEKEEYTGGPFDIIYSQMVLHHIRDTDALFKKFYRLLSPEGILAIADLYTEDGSFHNGDMSVHRGFDPEKLAATLLQQGFLESQVEPCYIISKDVSGAEHREYPVFLLTTKKKRVLSRGQF
jgi:tRNA (cmo5U34)-methyltransferase